MHTHTTISYWKFGAIARTLNLKQKNKIKVIRNSQPLRISDTKVDMFEIVVVETFSFVVVGVLV